MGIHRGTPEPTFDAVTKGYDYYGPDVNIASRLEGQAEAGTILCSASSVTAEIAAAHGLQVWLLSAFCL